MKKHQKSILRFSNEDMHGESVWEVQYPTAFLPNLRDKFWIFGHQREMLGQPLIEGTSSKPLIHQI
jgi:hypothetical protein